MDQAAPLCMPPRPCPSVSLNPESPAPPNEGGSQTAFRHAASQPTALKRRASTLVDRTQVLVVPNGDQHVRLHTRRTWRTSRASDVARFACWTPLLHVLGIVDENLHEVTSS